MRIQWLEEELHQLIEILNWPDEFAQSQAIIEECSSDGIADLTPQMVRLTKASELIKMLPKVAQYVTSLTLAQRRPCFTEGDARHFVQYHHGVVICVPWLLLHPPDLLNPRHWNRGVLCDILEGLKSAQKIGFKEELPKPDVKCAIAVLGLRV